MKRAIIVLAILGVGVCAGLAAPEVVKKFPWASDEMNKPCGKTELEYRCDLLAVKPTDTVIAGLFDIEEFTLEPNDTGYNWTFKLKTRADAAGKAKAFLSDRAGEQRTRSLCALWVKNRAHGADIKAVRPFGSIGTVYVDGKKIGAN